MERARRWKSKSASGIDGIGQVLKNKDLSGLSTDSSAYIDASTRDSLPFVLELGQSSPKQTAETPIKELLAREMSKEFYPKKRSPSVIAKLMGLEGLPSPRHVHRQLKRLPESNQQKNVLINTQKVSLMEQQEFKDVYEDMEASHFINSQWLPRWSSDSMLTKPEMDQIQQKIMEAKPDPPDENFRQLKEMDDILGLPNSVKASSLKFGQNPDSFSWKFLNDQQILPSSCRHNHIAAQKPSTNTKYDDNAKKMNSVKETPDKFDTFSHLKHEGSLHPDPQNHHRAHISHKASKSQSEEKFGKTILPVRIVLLKPNLGKVQNARTSLPLHDHSSDYLPNFSNMNENSSFRGTETVSSRRAFPCYDGGLINSMSKEARNITCRMKNGCDWRMTSISSRIRGYTGDESSCDDFESDSNSESEMFNLHSRNSLGCDCRFPYYNFVDMNVEKEVKKKLSERSKVRHRYRDAHIASKESTMGELLVKRNRERRPRYLNNKVGFGMANSELGSNNGTRMWDGPLGISCRDDWKDKTNKISTRSRSLPPSLRRRSQRGIICHDALHGAKILIHSDPVSHYRSEAVKENLNQKEDIMPKYSNPCSKIYIPYHERSINELDSPSAVNYEIKMEANVEDLPKQPPVFQTASNDKTSTIPESDVLKTPEHQNIILPLQPLELFPKQAPLVVHNGCTVFHQGDSIFQELPEGSPKNGSPSLQCFGTEPDFSESSKEIDHLSPVSVLEIPFTEEITSTTECFERVGTGLRELRMQLQLLKMESGTRGEDVVDVVSLQSPTASEGNCTVGANSWEASYISDVLTDSGFEESGIDIFKIWSTSECPLDPVLFNNLEKKYSNTTTMPKYERKMLFDRINSALFEILEQHIDTCPWVMPKMVGLDSNLQKVNVRNAVEKLICQNFAYEEELSGVQWLYSKKEMDQIGNEIENILVDDIILEVICECD